MNFMTDIFKANEKPVTFKTHRVVNAFDTKGEESTFTLDGLVSHSGGSSPVGNPSDNSQSVSVRVFFPHDDRVAALSVSAEATIDDVDYKVVDVDTRIAAPTGYSITVHLSREVR